VSTSAQIFTGSIVALVTPFRDGRVDEEAVGRLTEMHAAAGTNAIVVSGTTGESPSLSEEERLRLIAVVKEAAKGRVHVIAGTGTNDTRKTIAASEKAEKAGADALLVVTPYYNKPTQDGLLAHYRALADAVGIPICLYSVPGRTGIAIAPETVAALAAHPRIAALKEAGGSADRVSQVLELSGITVLSGDDPLTVPMMALGAKGVVSVTANVVPRENAEMVRAAAAGDYEKARALHYRLYPLCRALFAETNPIPVKAAMELLGLIGGEIRLPLTPLSTANRERLRKALEEFGLLARARRGG
jgi:4-hydroxy-tetrahydrodipicolinate synthase